MTPDEVRKAAAQLAPRTAAAEPRVGSFVGFTLGGSREVGRVVQRDATHATVEHGPADRRRRRDRFPLDALRLLYRAKGRRGPWSEWWEDADGKMW